MSNLHETQPWSPDYRYVVGELACKAYLKALSPDNLIARRLRAKFWPDCAILDTSMKFGTVVDHD